jgi:hypothetical protein
VLDIRPRPLFCFPYNVRGANVKSDVHWMNVVNCLKNKYFSELETDEFRAAFTEREFHSRNRFGNLARWGRDDRFR